MIRWSSKLELLDRRATRYPSHHKRARESSNGIEVPPQLPRMESALLDSAPDGDTASSRRYPSRATLRLKIPIRQTIPIVIWSHPNPRLLTECLGKEGPSWRRGWSVQRPQTLPSARYYQKNDRTQHAAGIEPCCTRLPLGPMRS
jgi:hypothetical protein